jgi:lysophospholipase L1-like esterase
MWRERFAACVVMMLTTAHAAASDLRYLALGDSYTIGESVAAERRWPMQLVRELRAHGVAVADPVVVARTGWTTDELSAALDQTRLDPPYDLVSLLIGVNNQYRGRDVEEYRGEFVALLERAIGYAGGHAARVVVLSIPDWGVTPFGARSGRDPAQIAQALDAYNAVAREESRRRHVAWVDITGISRRPDVAATLVADDGLHPSAAQYERWMRHALPVVEGLLARTP